ncbi:MATE family efflux transporter [Rhodopila sp.]|uniref:MATE family efflux transporter n=1 Tax=Rhodopila sp. TaxID=2480087 RepID=UPI003D1084AF
MTAVVPADAAAAEMTDRSVRLRKPAMDRRTQALLDAPLVPLLLRLAAPNILLMLAQSATGLIETYFVGKLGTDALAGVSIVFPGVMLMQMISAGSMGGGISASVARALGGGRADDAASLVWHALVINGVLGLVCTAAVLTFGPELYRALGGSDATLHAALAYSNVIYAGAILLWLMNALASVIRGTGNMLVPGAVICGGALLLIPISPALIFGWGPFPRMGVSGGATALVGYYLVGIVVLAAYLWGGLGVVRPGFRVRLRTRLFMAILRIGALASTTSIQTNLTIMLTTGMVGAFGPAALAGFGTGSRLEYLMVPIAFGVGGPLVAIVGTNIGAGQGPRALHAAWIGGAIGFALTEAVGIAAAVFPRAWLSLFDSDPAMIQTGSQYLRIVGPCYGFFGLGLVLYFASQGAGRLGWPVAAQFFRLMVAGAGSLIALRLGGGLTSVFVMIGVALAVFGLTVAASIASGSWSGRRAA